MKPMRVTLQNIFSGSLFGIWGFLLLLGTLVVLSTILTSPLDDSRHSRIDVRLQEEIGYAIQALGRYDRERTEGLKQAWAGMVQRAEEVKRDRLERLQEALGQGIAQAGHKIFTEQLSLRTSIEAATEDVQRFNREKDARWQEHLGRSIIVASRRAMQWGESFPSAFQREVNRQKRIEERTSQRLTSRLESLKVQESQFQKNIPLLYREALESSRRSARIQQASEVAWISLILNGLKKDLSWSRQPEDYMQIADQTRQILMGPRVVPGFVEYGLPALAGLMLVMVWVAAITRKDCLQSMSSKPIRENLTHLWKKGGGIMSQSITVFSWPREVMFGNNVSAEVGRYATMDGAQQAMVLTDEGVSQNGLLNSLKSSLTQSGVEFEVYDQVRGEVPDTVIEEVYQQCKQTKPNLIIAVGGGSVIDTAKAVGILLANGGNIQDYEGVDKVPWSISNLYVVPTMAGCGSENSQFCVFLDTKQKKKLEIISRKIIPQRIFIDPLLTMSMPPELTASCGMDALANGIEAYFSTWASPFTDALALHAIRLISGNLRSVVANGRNLEARQQMVLAAFEAGLAFSNARCGAVHALGHPISGLFNVPQRLGDAILLPHVMRFNMNANMDRMVDVAVAMGEPVEGLSKREAAEKAIASIQCLMVDIGLPTTLEKVGVEKRAISELTQQALQDVFLGTNPRILGTKDIEHIYESAFLEYSEPMYRRIDQEREVFH
jgi:alcohol dehydrogenase class IV